MVASRGSGLTTLLDWKHKLMLALLGAGLIGGVVGFRSWLSEHDDRLQAEAQAKVKDQVIAQNQQEIKSLADQIQQVRDDGAKQTAQLEKTIASLKTPDQQLAWVISQLKTQAGQPPITINVPKNPEQPATISVPQERVPEVTEAVKGCLQCKLDLTTKTQELTYTQQQNQKLADSLVAETDKAKTWEKAAKGGSLIHRALRAAKYVIIGMGAGAVVLCGTGHCK